MVDSTKTQEEQDKAIDKIKKLLALSKNNSNSNEAQKTLLKAQELMTKFDVDISLVEGEEAITHVNEFCEHKWDMAYRQPLASVLAKNFRCRLWFNNGRVVFLGRQLDARICKEVFEYTYYYINSEGNKRYNRAKEEGARTKGVYNSYALGFIEGLAEAFEEQCRALIIITPKDVEDKYIEMTAGWVDRSSGMRIPEQDLEAFVEGKMDGKKFMNQKKQLESA